MATIQVSIVTALGTTISAETSFPVREVVTVIIETATMTTDIGTTTSTYNTNTSTSTTDTGTTTTTDPNSTKSTSTPTIDNDVVVTAPQSYQGTIQTTSSYKLTDSYENGLNDAGQSVLDVAGG